MAACWTRFIFAVPVGNYSNWIEPLLSTDLFRPKGSNQVMFAHVKTERRDQVFQVELSLAQQLFHRIYRAGKLPPTNFEDVAPQAELGAVYEQNIRRLHKRQATLQRVHLDLDSFCPRALHI
jgi:hypothetical protein